ncbi:MAG: hypothetical protein HY293_19865 [Planctomycetes bacterium]|nr:hypothetical protein [Planctomycetota bacterium]
MRRILLSLGVLIGAVLSGLLIASLLLKAECPDCGGAALYFAVNPGQLVDGPIVLDCLRCGDRGRVSLFNARVGADPDPVIARVLHESNRGPWFDTYPKRLEMGERVKKAGLTSALDWTWPGNPDFRDCARFVREDGKGYVLVILDVDGGGGSHLTPARILLFDPQGTLLDSVRVTAFRSPSEPKATFIVSPQAGSPCIRIRLLLWKNALCERVEVDHAGRTWSTEPVEPKDKLDHLDWNVYLRGGKLRVADAATGKSIAD